MESKAYEVNLINQQEVIESLNMMFNNSKLSAVMCEINGNDDSNPSSGNGSLTTQLSTSTEPLSEDEDSQEIPATA